MKSADDHRKTGTVKLPRASFFLVLFFTLGVFAAAIALMTFHLRSAMWQQMIQQDAEVLHAAAVVQETEFLDETASAEDALPSLLSASTLRGVFSIRIFDPAGKFLSSFPDDLKAENLAREDLALLNRGSAASHYLQQGNISKILQSDTDLGPVPLLQVLIPIRTGTNILGSAEFLLDGQKTAAAFSRLDRDLLGYGAALWLASSLLVCPLMWWAYRRLQKANQLLAQRSSDLLRANYELAMSAKTSAIGAVTAHLLHGLKNPLFGLQNFVSARGQNPGENDTSEWEAAADSTRRIQAMINDIVRILNESDYAKAQYELTIEELGAILQSKFSSQAAGQFKQLHFQMSGEGALQNHHANLVALILANLIENALQAVPAGGRIELNSSQSGGEMEFRVADNGRGIPPERIDELFVPCRSSKEGGTGIGLAISNQLAQHLGATLRLERNSTAGAVFKVSLPLRLFLRENALAEDQLLVR